MAPREQVRRNVVVVAASAGGVVALRLLLARLPRNLPAAVMVVLHLPATAVSMLDRTLDRVTPLTVGFAEGGEPLVDGHVYLAPPDRHLLVGPDGLLLSAGPRQNGNRPAADVLFFSAASAHGPRTLAVVLTGVLNDGAAGCAAVELAGGLVAVQDPEDAEFTGMPAAALRAVPEAFTGSLDQLAGYIRTQAGEPAFDDGHLVDPEVESTSMRRNVPDSGGRGLPA